ncbi:T9SS type A sorting domain-containing protein [Flavobacterium psychrotolerans]|uniref:Secretion system C-terminal sorting domain-containing protein n=1 Tax=Flavobacterium psychrotolerans TaxID=2169410 RepID=A0A2U1JGW3_9FLAO|nr:T9SS type A sorting domain-containing protein [Flavobacterium psychrotolerans]PWA04178.1 hypothetical protein DB895_12415 [Flavobacterium psychrotolerans]
MNKYKKTTKKLLLCFILLISLMTFAQTDVSGPSFTNTVWSLSGSPYNLTGDVQIPNGISLTIESGVQINFNSDYEILIKGTLIANGTSNLPITFNGGISGKAMLMFKNTDLNNSKLSFIDFKGPKNALQLAQESEHQQDNTKNSGILNISDISLNNTRVQTNGYGTTAKLFIENATISSTTIIGVYPRSESIELKNCTITDCLVNSDSYNYGIIINECVAKNTQFSIGCCGANLKFLKSILSDSSILDGGGQPINGPVKIIESMLTNTPLNIPASEVEITGSTFNYNSSNGLVFGNGIFECSQITGNNLGTAIKLTGYNGYDIGKSIIISNSTIKDNSVGIDIINGNLITISNSNIYNNETFNIKNSSVKNIIATNNWWGTADTSIINSTIYDYYNNINFGVVNYNNSFNSLINNCSTLSIDTFLKNKKAIIYPNPNNGIVNIDLGSKEEVSINVFTLEGQLIYKIENIYTQFHQFELNQTSGLYIIEINTPKNKQYYKLIIK